ncbi:hypothetical protein QE152_g24560 [Popillia japonica]|uniref:C2H2-type domain-containing protein n=1 Tax=Popillia japonica TaxID=7064 RepID=A0AAW1KDV3_POPJA
MWKKPTVFMSHLFQKILSEVYFKRSFETNSSRNSVPTHYVRIKLSNPFTCNKCPRRYKYERDLRYHQKICGTAPMHSCTMCDYTTNRKFNLKLHYRHRHKIDT